jgi:probable F420-dependent oxidoreductase
VNVWLSLPFLPAGDLRRLAEAAAAAGVTGLALSDHVCVPASFESPYPYAAPGRSVTLPPEAEMPDPLVAIAALAGLAPGLRFMTNVLVAPLRHPVALAKQAATVAALIGNRLDLGLGAGWLREEFEALGLDTFAVRGKVLDEMIPLLRRLWTGEPVAHRGDHFTFDAVAVNPTPGADVPLFVGGYSDPALRRCARWADGWVGITPGVDELESILGRLAAARDAAGTAGRPLEIRTGVKGAVTAERVQALRKLGVTSLLLAPWQIGERRESLFDLPVAAIADALPGAVASVLAA